MCYADQSLWLPLTSHLITGTSSSPNKGSPAEKQKGRAWEEHPRLPVSGFPLLFPGPKAKKQTHDQFQLQLLRTHADHTWDLLSICDLVYTCGARALLSSLH